MADTQVDKQPPRKPPKIALDLMGNVPPADDGPSLVVFCIIGPATEIVTSISTAASITVTNE